MQAETVVPADKERAAAELRAAGDAALKAETGRAQGEALEALAATARHSPFGAYPGVVTEILERITATVGIDVASILPQGKAEMR